MSGSLTRLSDSAIPPGRRIRGGLILNNRTATHELLGLSGIFAGESRPIRGGRGGGGRGGGGVRGGGGGRGGVVGFSNYVLKEGLSLEINNG